MSLDNGIYRCKECGTILRGWLEVWRHMRRHDEAKALADKEAR